MNTHRGGSDIRHRAQRVCTLHELVVINSLGLLKRKEGIVSELKEQSGLQVRNNRFVGGVAGWQRCLRTQGRPSWMWDEEVRDWESWVLHSLKSEVDEDEGLFG